MSMHTAGADSIASADPHLYPVFLKLAGRRVLVVGGGRVACSKIAALVEAGAAVSVVAPQILPEIVRQRVRCIRRAFRPEDLAGVWFVVAAAPPGVNRRVERAARQRCLFVNAVDDPQCASAYLGGVVRKGGVTLAVSTAGRVAALAGMLREAIEALLPDDIEQWVMRGEAARATWKQQGVPHDARRPLLLRVLNAIYAEREVGEPRREASDSEREPVEAGRDCDVKANKNS